MCVYWIHMHAHVNHMLDALALCNMYAIYHRYASMWKGGMMLYSGKYGILEKIGE